MNTRIILHEEEGLLQSVLTNVVLWWSMHYYAITAICSNIASFVRRFPNQRSPLYCSALLGHINTRALGTDTEHAAAGDVG